MMVGNYNGKENETFGHFLSPREVFMWDESLKQHVEQIKVHPVAVYI